MLMLKEMENIEEKELGFKLYDINNLTIDELKNKIKNITTDILVGNIEYATTPVDDFYIVNFKELIKIDNFEDQFFNITDIFLSFYKVLMPREDLFNNQLLNENKLKEFKNIQKKHAEEVGLELVEKDIVIPNMLVNTILLGKKSSYELIISLNKEVLK